MTRRLPIVGDVLNLLVDDEEVIPIVILAVDPEEAIWTVWDRAEDQLKMVTLDENSNWFWVDPSDAARYDQ